MHQRLGIVLKPLKTDVNPVKFSEKHQLTYSKMPTKPIAYILLGCQQTRALPVTPYQVTVLESKQLHRPELFPALPDSSHACSWPVPHSQRWKKHILLHTNSFYPFSKKKGFNSSWFVHMYSAPLKDKTNQRSWVLPNAGGWLNRQQHRASELPYHKAAAGKASLSLTVLRCRWQPQSRGPRDSIYFSNSTQ